jgi:hypothetical protein
VEIEDGDVHGIAARLPGLAFDDRGSRLLKGVPDRWPVLAVHDRPV